MAGGFAFDPIDTTTLHGLSCLLEGQELQLLLTLLSYSADRYQWLTIQDSEWDELEALIASVMGKLMANMLIGSVVPIATQSIPDNMLLCDGSSYQRVDYPELYAVIATSLVINSDYFYVPNLVDKFLRGSDTASEIGDTGGADTHTLSTSEMPSHYHTYSQPTFNIDVESVGVPDPTGVGIPMIPGYATSSAGGGNSHNNMPAYYVLRYGIIAQ